MGPITLWLHIFFKIETLMTSNLIVVVRYEVWLAADILYLGPYLTSATCWTK